MCSALRKVAGANSFTVMAFGILLKSDDKRPSDIFQQIVKDNNDVRDGKQWDYRKDTGWGWYPLEENNVAVDSGSVADNTFLEDAVNKEEVDTKSESSSVNTSFKRKLSWDSASESSGLSQYKDKRPTRIGDIVVDDTKSESTFNYVPFQNEMAFGKQDFASDCTESTSVPMFRPLPSGHVVKRNDDIASMASSSLFTRNSQKDADDGEHSLEDGVNELFIACQSGEPGLVKLILERGGVDVNMFSSGDGSTRQRRQGELEDDYTPLLIACTKGHEKIVEQLISVSSMDVNKANSDGITPLWLACRYGHAQIARYLLTHPRINVNKADNSGEKPLYAASRWGHTQVVKHLLTHPQIGINKVDKHGWTPLKVAADAGQTDIVEIIRNHPTYREDGETTPSITIPTITNLPAIEGMQD